MAEQHNRIPATTGPRYPHPASGMPRMNRANLVQRTSIGILCNPQWDAKKRQLRVTNQLAALQKLVETATSYGANCFLFRLEDVQLSTRQVKGYTIFGDATTEAVWREQIFPFPNVVYDQLVSRKIERSKAYVEKKELFAVQYASRLFNDGFLDKWRVHEWLMGDQRTTPYLPETIRHSTSAKAVLFLQKHSTTFLKPLHGSLGLGIIRFIRNGDGSFSYEVKSKGASLQRGKAATAKDVIQEFSGRLKTRPYIWQQGIALTKHRDRPVDIRILMQRDDKGEWQRTKMFARVAKTGEFTSNLSTGGEALPVGLALYEMFPKTEVRKKCRKLIGHVAMLVVDALEAQSGKKFGELGIDLGVDMNGHVWIIEVNSKPRKSATTEKGRQDLVDLSFERPIRYALYLASNV